MSALEAKAHELLGHLGPTKLAAVVQLLEVMVEDDALTDEDRRRLLDGHAWFAKHQGVPMEEVLGDFGLKPDDFPLSK